MCLWLPSLGCNLCHSVNFNCTFTSVQRHITVIHFFAKLLPLYIWQTYVCVTEFNFSSRPVCLSFNFQIICVVVIFFVVRLWEIFELLPLTVISEVCVLSRNNCIEIGAHWYSCLVCRYFSSNNYSSLIGYFVLVLTSQ